MLPVQNIQTDYNYPVSPAQTYGQVYQPSVWEQDFAQNNAFLAQTQSVLDNICVQFGQSPNIFEQCSINNAMLTQNDNYLHALMQKSGIDIYGVSKTTTDYLNKNEEYLKGLLSKAQNGQTKK